MEIQQLRTFIAVAEELHFGRAAEQLHMAQPPVSRTIKQLERELGVTLFNRSTRSVELTPAAEALLPRARDIIAATHLAKRETIAASKGERGSVSVAYAGTSTHLLMGILSRELRAAHPDIRLKLRNQQFAQPALARVLAGEVDVSLGRWDFVPEALESRILQKEDLVLAVPATHALADQDGVHIAQLEDEPFVSLPHHEGSVLGDRLRRLSFNAGFEPHVVQRVPDSSTAMALVSAEVGCSLTVSSVAKNTQDEHIRFLQVRDHSRPIYLRMAWRPESANPALGSVLELARQVWPHDSEDAQS
ncbi:LysR family transcriptional regulator [Corynebacterium tapiri]|uniref:LysR family transcriptional regulator n=1 Tax=Corynebacterium tapiri TaxID=1448266 RepID=A0A5C4U765_9CORY|nr:LysR substrate-binding domain-containing protein [Corynebacterium tapiri]TNL99331.1 LysR family transcriptional regulator [Corynebacterium tapiri]